jgi:hypothetical protein
VAEAGLGLKDLSPSHQEGGHAVAQSVKRCRRNPGGIPDAPEAVGEDPRPPTVLVGGVGGEDPRSKGRWRRPVAPFGLETVPQQRRRGTECETAPVSRLRGAQLLG